MNIMQKNQKGFTLIELMIVVAIIGILAAVAIPQYQDYITKTKLSKVAVSVEAVKLAMADYMQNNAGGFPAGATTAANATLLGLPGAPTATAEVSVIDITTSTGAIVAKMQNIGLAASYDGQTVTFKPTAGATAVTWGVTCSGTATAVRTKVLGC